MVIVCKTKTKRRKEHLHQLDSFFKATVQPAGRVRRWKLNPVAWRLNELGEARSRLCRNRFPQIGKEKHWKTLEQIYKDIHLVGPLSIREMAVTFCWKRDTFSLFEEHVFASTSDILFKNHWCTFRRGVCCGCSIFESQIFYVEHAVLA